MEYVEGNTPYLLDTLKKERDDRIAKGKEPDALSLENSIHVASYATAYSVEDLFKSSENIKKLTWSLIALTGVLVVLTLKLIGFTTR